MFALGLRYLMGWAMAAADGREKQHPEWPPHPDRVFLALAAGWFESGEDTTQGDALRWLEALPPPAIAATEAHVRGSGQRELPVTSYVPVNDSKMGTKLPTSNDLKTLKDAGLDVLPEYRSRQPRSFPVAIPESPDVFLIWPDADPTDHLAALQALTHQVTHVGHSASLVQMWVEDAPPTAYWRPTEGIGSRKMHVSHAGRLDGLRQSMNREAYIVWHDLQEAIRQAKEARKMLSDKTEKKVAGAQIKALEQRFTQLGKEEPITARPADARWHPYTKASEERLPESTAMPLFDHQLVVTRLHGRRLPLTSTLALLNVLRGTLLKHCPEPIPEWLSGHQPGTSAPTRQPHLALLPLPFVGDEHSDGRIIGIGLALPRNLSPDETARCLNPSFWNAHDGDVHTLRLFDGQWLETTAELELRDSPPHSLRSSTWTRRSKVWASVTPVALDRHFKGPHALDQAAESLKQACERIGLPRPETVLLNKVSSVQGTPPAHAFPPLTRKDGSRRKHMHATLIFADPVTGPILIGAGRFRGYGLCRPMDGVQGHA